MDAVFDLHIETVVAVTGAANISKDRRQRETRQQERRKNESGLFAKTLEEAVEKEAPAQFKTVIYGRNGKMSTVNYYTRNY